MTDQTTTEKTPGASDRSDAARFQLFAVLFSLATVLYHRWDWFDPELATLPLAAAFWVLLRPSAPGRLLGLALLQGAFAFGDLPDGNTNRTLQVFFSVVLVGAWLGALVRERRLPSAAAWFRRLAPPLRLSLLAIYFWAAFHKLNTDFFDIDKSCGVELYRRVTEKVGFLPWPDGPGALTVVVWATVLVEGALPLLLVARRTRAVGLGVAAVLHFGFGLTMFFDFSMTMLSLLLLFTPEGFASALLGGRPPWTRLGWSQARWRWITTAGAAAFAVATEWIFWDMFDPLALAWWLLVPALGFAFWKLARGRWSWESPIELLRSGPLLALVPLALFAMGTCPYIGSKTETSLAMYSNLRTEGGVSNHLLLTQPLYLFDYQRNLVRVLESSDPQLQALANEGHPVPLFTLRKRVHGLAWTGYADQSVTYERAGAVEEYRRSDTDSALATPPTFFERKFLRFRTILPADANVCSH